MRFDHAVVPLVMVISTLPLLGQTSTKGLAKANYELGEASGNAVSAHDSYCTASVLEPKNSKYQKKCLESAKSASAELEASARQRIKTDPSRALRDLQEALKLDQSNAAASQALKELTSNIQTANAQVNVARERPEFR
jgi:hypothetical protein